MKFWDYKNLNRDKIGNMSQVAGIRRYEFVDGKAKGVEALEIQTGSGLSFTVLPGRGMDIAWTNYRGVPLSYMSKTGVVSPSYFENEGMNWLHNFFAGALTTCGLLNVGGPKTVKHSVIGERQLGLHGRISNCAAEQVCVFEDVVDGQYVMRVSGLMSEGVLHGEHVTLRREIETAFGSDKFTIRDTVTNHDAKPQNVSLLYHINFGYPLLDSSCRLIANSVEVTPQSEEAKNDIADVYNFSEPVLNITERCYAHKFAEDKDGNVKLALVNDELELGVALFYNQNELPFFNQWKMQNKKEYVIGLEPCTKLPGDDDAELLIAPGEKKTFEITYMVLNGKEAIERFEADLK